MYRPRFRYSMRAMLVLMTLCCIGVAWQVGQFRSRKQLIHDIREAGGSSGVKIEGPELLRRWVGDDEYFFQPVRISFGSTSGRSGNPGVDRLNEILARCAQLPELETLDLRGSLANDASLAIVAKTPNLRTLRLSGTSVTDSGVVQLYELSQLRNMWLGGTAVSDECFTQLQRLMPSCRIDRSK